MAEIKRVPPEPQEDSVIVTLSLKEARLVKSVLGDTSYDKHNRCTLDSLYNAFCNVDLS
jgi:hypothetical protein